MEIVKTRADVEGSVMSCPTFRLTKDGTSSVTGVKIDEEALITLAEIGSETSLRYVRC